jgi:hypothetical protein
MAEDAENKPKIVRGFPPTSIMLTVDKNGKVVSRVVRNERTAEEWRRLAEKYPHKPLRRPPPRD